MDEPKPVIPVHIGRLMSKEDQQKYGFKTPEEAAEYHEFKLEKELHEFFLAFLHRHELGYYHAPMDRRSYHGNGMPDFGVFRDSRIVWIEFKINKNKLSEVQKNKIATMLADGNTVQVCYTLLAAVQVVSQFFNLSI